MAKWTVFLLLFGRYPGQISVRKLVIMTDDTLSLITSEGVEIAPQRSRDSFIPLPFQFITHK
jgi:hypothetical protein